MVLSVWILKKSYKDIMYYISLALVIIGVATASYAGINTSKSIAKGKFRSRAGNIWIFTRDISLLLILSQICHEQQILGRKSQVPPFWSLVQNVNTCLFSTNRVVLPNGRISHFSIAFWHRNRANQWKSLSGTETKEIVTISQYWCWTELWRSCWISAASWLTRPQGSSFFEKSSN